MIGAISEKLSPSSHLHVYIYTYISRATAKFLEHFLVKRDICVVHLSKSIVPYTDVSKHERQTKTHTVPMDDACQVAKHNRVETANSEPGETARPHDTHQLSITGSEPQRWGDNGPLSLTFFIY